MKKLLSLILVLVMSISLLTACGNGDKDSGGDTNETAETTEAGDETEDAEVPVSDGGMVLALASQPDTIDPALNSSVDGASYIIHTFSGLVGYSQKDDGSLELVADIAKELPEPEETEDGMVQYVFELKDDLKWSDGSELTANDLVYAWNRAADPETGADYGYMFDVIDGYAAMTETDDDGKVVNPDATLNVTASEDGKTLTVVLPVDVPYFYELCAFPTYMPVKEDIVAENEGWATSADTYIGNGPYKAVTFDKSSLVVQKNENYHNADAILTDEIVFAFNGDDTSLLANYKSGSYLFIDNVPNDEIKSLQQEYADEFFIEGQLGTYYISFNVNDEHFSDFSHEEKTKIRQALSLMIDRNYIVEEIGQAGQVPANGFVPMGLTEPDSAEYVSKNGPNRDGNGYYSVDAADYSANSDQAITLLEEVAESSGLYTVSDDGMVSTEFPTIDYITNEGTGHEAIATYVQGVVQQYGINMNVETQEWNTFLNTRKDGNYSVARNGWLADYNDPISFLDMWITNSGNNDSQLGRGDHASFAGYSYNGDGKTWAESYDAIIAQVKASKDPVERFELMHQAEDILMSTGAICPIYYYTDLFMSSPKLEGAFVSPLGYKYFMYATVNE
jgi:oligopeptide transport system substrate-binding protein